MKSSSDTIGNGTRELAACSAVPQPTVPPRAPGCKFLYYLLNLQNLFEMGSSTFIAQLTTDVRFIIFFLY